MDGRPAANADIEVASNRRADEVRSYEANHPLRQGGSHDITTGVGMAIVAVTARKQAERSTKESEERFRSLIQASAAMICTAGPLGTFIRPQPSWTRFTGQPATASLGWGCLGCIHPGDVEATDAGDGRLRLPAPSQGAPPAKADILLSARDITSAQRQRLVGADCILKKGETSMPELTASLRELDAQPAQIVGL